MRGLRSLIAAVVVLLAACTTTKTSAPVKTTVPPGDAGVLVRVVQALDAYRTTAPGQGYPEDPAVLMRDGFVPPGTKLVKGPSSGPGMVSYTRPSPTFFILAMRTAKGCLVATGASATPRTVAAAACDARTVPLG